MENARGTILIVDDEENVRKVLRRRLEAEFFYCVTASSGQEALKEAAMRGFDVVLLDILMPGLSGIEVLPKLVSWHPAIQVIMITSVADSDTISEAMRLGAYDYVTKPFNMNDLVARVEKALERKKSL